MGLVEQLKSLVTKTSKAAKKASPDAAKTCKVKLADAKKKTKEAETIAKKAIKVAKDAMKDLEKAKTRKVVVVKLRGKGKNTRRGGVEKKDLDNPGYIAETEAAKKNQPNENPGKVNYTPSDSPDPRPSVVPDTKDDPTAPQGGRRRRY